MISTQILKKVPLFSMMDEKDLNNLLPMFRERRFNRNSIIFNQEEEGDTFFFIIEGSVKVIIMSEDGREVLLSILRKNDFFGEMSLVDGLPRSATVMAIEDTTIILLKRNDFLAQLKTHPEMALRLMQEMSKRIRKADERINSLSLLSVYGRVAKVLLEIAKENGKRTAQGFLLEKRPTHTEIASIAGTSRETVSRIMKDLCTRGYIMTEGRKLTVYEPGPEIKSTRGRNRKREFF